MISREQCKQRHKIMEITCPSNIMKSLDASSSQKRITFTKFGMTTSRYNEGQRLPLFLQNMHTRSSIAGLNNKMIEENNNNHNDIIESPIKKTKTVAKINKEKIKCSLSSLRKLTRDLFLEDGLN